MLNDYNNDIKFTYDEIDDLEEGFMSKIRDKRLDKKIGKKESQIEKIRNKIENAKERDTDVSREFIVKGEEKIEKLMKEIEELKEKIAERQVVAQESFFDYDEVLESLQEELNEKYEELELTVDYLEEGIKNGIVVAKEKFKGKIDAHKQKKLAKKIAKKEEKLAKLEDEEKIEKLTNEIEELKAKLNVAQESYYVDHDEIELIEESLKEKIGKLNGKISGALTNLAVKRYKNVDSITKTINKLERQNENYGKILNERELSESKVTKIIRSALWFDVLFRASLLAPILKDELQPKAKLKACIRINNKYMNALNKRREQLQDKEEVQESAGLDFILEFLDEE